MSREDILSYEEKFGPKAAADFLLLVGPDDFKGTYEEYSCLMDMLQGRIWKENVYVQKLKDWLSTFASVKNTPVATLALMKAVDVLKSQEKAGNITHQEKT